MIINDNNRFVYIAVPKTATSSMHSALGEHTGHPEPAEHHMAYEKALERYPHIENYFSFGFVRNPWAKMVSTYYDFTLHRGRQYSAKVRMEHPLLSEFADFEDFCINLKNSDWCMDIFFVPQTWLVTDENDTPLDFIGRYENLEEDFRFVCEKIGFGNRNLEKYNVGKHNNKDYRAHFKSDKAIHAIGDLFASDVRMFGYEF